MHWYKRNIGDYHKKAGRLTMLQHGAYTLLMDSCYDREKFPTMEEALEWLWASTPEEIQAVEFVLKRFFTEENGVYVQHRIREELDDYAAKAENNKRIALEREAKRRESRTNKHESCSTRTQDVNETPPNQEPITNNQEPETINQKDKDLRFDFEAVAAVWNECCLESETPSRKSKVVTEATKKSLPTTYKKYCAIKKKGGKEPASRIDFCKSYFPAVLNWGSGFVGKPGPNENWKMNLEHAAKVGTYDKVVEWLSDD